MDMPTPVTVVPASARVADHSAALPRMETTSRPTPIEQIVLVFQGGGALGAYQAGVYQGLTENGIDNLLSSWSFLIRSKISVSGRIAAWAVRTLV